MLRSWLKGVTLTLAVIAAGFMGTWVYNARQPHPWDPLYGPMSGQQITGQTADYVIVKGQKCSSADGPILVRGNVFAQQVSPVGSPSPVGNTGVAVRLPGCTPLQFKNLYTQDMIDSTGRLGGQVVWRFLGNETPIGECVAARNKVPDGATGITRVTGYDKVDYVCWRVPGGVEWTWTTANFPLPYKTK